jgi:hypothetical protein
MSQILINDDLKQLDVIRRAGGSQRGITVSVETGCASRQR